jgi:hypothetical protein
MSKQLTAEELQQIRDLKQEYNTLAFTLGELQLKKVDIEEDIKTLSESRKALYDREKVLAKQLQEKYGEGSINLETGVVD